MTANEKDSVEVVSESDGGKRIDVLLSEIASVSRSRAQDWIASGNVLLNGKVCKKRDLVKAGDLLEYDDPEPEPIDCLPQDLPIDIVYEDGDLLVVNKPQGMVVHPAPGNPDGTLVNALLYHCGERLSSINGKIRPGIVHRIDKDTSGLLIVAKTDEAHNGLAEQIAKHDFTRIYEAVCAGTFREPEGVIDLPIAKAPGATVRRIVSTEGKPSRTRYRVLEERDGKALILLELETGRTHQIRVHLSAIGCPVRGDFLYGTEQPEEYPGRFALHSAMIAAEHPVTGEKILLTSRPAWAADIPETVLLMDID